MILGKASEDVLDFYGLERRRVFPEASSPMASNFKRLLSESDQVQRAQDKSDMFAHADARGSEIHALFIGGIDFGKANAGMSNWAYSTDGFARSTYHIDGVDSVVYEIGEGKPLVYLHGGGTYHGFEWARDFAYAFPPQLRATGLGLATTAGRVGSIFGPIVGGILLSTRETGSASDGGMGLTLTVGAVCAAMAVPAILSALTFSRARRLEPGRK